MDREPRAARGDAAGPAVTTGRRGQQAPGTADEAPDATGPVEHPTEPGRALTVFEEAILVSNRPGQPKVVAFLAGSNGSIDEQRLRVVVSEVLQRVPLARARLAPVKGMALRWQFPNRPDVDPVSVVTCRDEADLDRAFEEVCSTLVAPAASPPIRVRLMRRPGGDAIALVAQHVAMDGVGAMSLLREVVLAYGGTAGGAPADAAGEADAPSAGERPDEVLPAAPLWARAAAVVTALTDLVASRPARIAGATSTPGPGYGVHRVSVPTAQVAAAAHAGGVTVNDLLLAALHGTIESWNRSRGRTARTVRTRLPVNRRPPDHRWDVGNITAQAVVTTTTADRRAPGRLNAVIAAQTRTFKAQALTGGPASGFGVLGLLPVRLRLPLQRAAVALARPYLMPTGELPNLGRVDGTWSLGPDGPEITSLHFAGFTGMPQGLSLAAIGYRGRLSLTFGYRWTLLDRRAARDFAATYLAELRALTR